MQEQMLFQSPIGDLLLSGEKDYITGLELWKREEAPSEKTAAHSGILLEAYRQLEEYFAGRRIQFDLPLSLQGTSFQRRVWGELCKIPYGETRSYQEIAAAVGNPGAVRAVGGANGRNPIMIIVPCHRVIHKNGDISGFSCGNEVKKFLLDLENGKSKK
ncbi:MAG: methylated-DNA--[protein]-cysteine S-methyltransferase [Clostridiales bacterium]|nr:methylated-DNA--[protein]-cysteine S-methyltransferase [Clostridiales bacterium]